MVFDIETTGFSSLTCQIIEIGAVLVENGEITDRFSTFVNPKVPIPFRIEQLTSINDSMVMGAPTIEKCFRNSWNSAGMRLWLHTMRTLIWDLL